MKSHFFQILTAAAIATSSTPSGAEPLSIAATEWPPFYGAEMEDGGFMTQIVVEAFARTGRDTEVDFLPWKRAFEGTKDGKFDALFTMWHRPEREKHFIFSDALPSNELVFLVRSGASVDFQGYEAMKNIDIGVVRGYAPPPGFEDAGLKVSEARDDEENLRKLLRGRVDAVLTDRIVAQHIINTTFEDQADEFAWMSPPVHVDVQYMVVPKVNQDSEELMASFNSALSAMTNDGTLAAIMADHGF
ncbi:MAG: transporter substrate-binding domain-containing protein [Pseudomonadota bacterium]